MLTLALDTCDSRGSIALLGDDELLGAIAHETQEDYSSWLLPNVTRLLAAHKLRIRDVELFAPTAGPGSFTGIRIGLTSVKAWSEVYGTKIAPVSRLAAIASQAHGTEPLVAGFFDAQREQVFGAVFRREPGGLQLLNEELVIAPEAFLAHVEQASGSAPPSWVSLDPEKISGLAAWQPHAQRGVAIQKGSAVLAPFVGKLGRQRAREGQLIDALALDAQYVRRSDAEIFWKGHAAR